MSTSHETTDAGRATPGRRPPRSRGRKLVRVALAVLGVLAVLVAADAALISSRIERIEVDLHAGTGTTWVVVGLDSREELPEGATADGFGSTSDVPGSRADVVLVLQETAAGLEVLSVPRDVMVKVGRSVNRLALTWLDGPQETLDALCGLGIPADHLVAVDLAGFASVVDTAGGLDVEVPAAVRDPVAGLLLERAGHHHLDGATALAMVRSRHPEQLVGGRWVPAEVDPDGRAATAGTVLSALAAAGDRATTRPWRLQQLAWVGAGSVAADEETSLAELAALARSGVGPVEVLPVGDPVGDSIARVATDATEAAVAAAGLSCGD